ncbi:MFS transporter [Nocardiopsis suaedae]|uniref:MFS transporter n=1 Tax=Nocardiopsis suaedae TaxID=3018444 RepID=A0ABT4TWB2_9ACTN|nr:MFS transporter [Nocardiopsis suaedae]MDA2808701.1 MFS transporter [Nocardiopsis suaedae]
MSERAAPGRAGVREWAGLAVLSLPVFLLSVDVTALHLALPHLSADLGATGTQQLWILDIYGFLLAGLLITMGTVGDRIGRRRLLMIGAAAFTAASAAAAYAPTAEALIAARALLGIAGATLMPSTMSLLKSMFTDDRQRATALALWMACFTAGAAAGPVIGGLLLEAFWWGSVFLMAVPVMALLLATGPFLLPEFRSPSPGRLDPLSVVLSLGALLPFIYALKKAAENGWSPLLLAALALAAVSGWLFARRQLRMDAPLLDLSLFRMRVFSAGLGSLLAANLVMGGVMLLLIQYLQLVKGLPPSVAGAWLVPFSLASMAASLASPALAGRLGTKPTMLLGLAVGATGLVLAAFLGPDTPVLWTGTVAAVIALGMTPLGVLVMTEVMAAAPEDRSGSAAAVNETFGEMGVSLGVAAMGALAAAVYRPLMAGSLPAGTPEEAAAPARDSLAGAVAAAESLPSGAAQDLLAAAQSAFMGGFAATTAVGAVVVAAVAFVIARYLTTGARHDAGDRTGAGADRSAA